MHHSFSIVTRQWGGAIARASGEPYICHKENTLKKIKVLVNLNDVREKNIIGQLNINSIRNKLNFLESETSNHLDMLLVSEIKIDESFPSPQFLVDGFFRPHRLNRRANGGGILLYVKDDISSCLLTEYKLQVTPNIYSSKLI